MAALVHFDKLVQIPIIVAHELLGVSTASSPKSFMNAGSARFPLLAEIRDFFDDFAKQIQAGAPNMSIRRNGLASTGQPTNTSSSSFTAEGRMQQFHDECGALLRSLASKGAANIDLLDEALRLNHALVKQPGENEDITVSCSRDLLVSIAAS